MTDRTSTGRAGAADRDALLSQAHAVLAALPRNHSDLLAALPVQEFMSRSIEHRDTMMRLATMWQAMGSVTALPWPTQADLDADSASDADDEQPSMQVPMQQPRWTMRVAALFLVCAIGVGLWFVQQPRSDALVTFATGIAESRDFELSDGSRAQLGAETKTSIEFSAVVRDVTLEHGQALFTVQKDSQRPFRVESGSAVAVAVGTVFDVRRYDGHSVISVVEGSVRVEDSAAIRVLATLTTGQQITIDDASGASAVRAGDIRQFTSWRHGRFTYVSEPLRDVISDVSRYSRTPIVWEAGSGAGMSYTGVVDQQGIVDWLEGLEAVFAVQVVEQSGRVLIRPRDAR